MRGPGQNRPPTCTNWWNRDGPVETDFQETDVPVTNLCREIQPKTEFMCVREQRTRELRLLTNGTEVIMSHNTAFRKQRDHYENPDNPFDLGEESEYDDEKPEKCLGQCFVEIRKGVVGVSCSHCHRKARVIPQIQDGRHFPYGFRPADFVAHIPLSNAEHLNQSRPPGNALAIEELRENSIRNIGGHIQFQHHCHHLVTECRFFQLNQDFETNFCIAACNRCDYVVLCRRESDSLIPILENNEVAQESVAQESVGDTGLGLESGSSNEHENTHDEDRHDDR